MEETPYIYDESDAPASKGKMAPWMIVLLVVLALCCLLVVLPFCVIAILSLLGPAVGDVFSDIILSI
ncbi:MAG: hypothetical protein DRJ03_14410 [Chloroflexi bacterium]|nr:MAG: hypothetical protein B6I35_08945 [Anaerolineaceae bacterium 4572_32.2]RLC78522.1 MAG: hypothetical protein DRI81_06510 [Chloroflexota bacterium]RLC84364.1 MAG: hypothetical protein DRJ03_14410 [Chloroflexota bacterium]HEY71991.1 hypothetical protein [Thermoflexia bacterium]